MNNQNRGPKAPKDPDKKRKNFYIMREIDIAASPKEDGGGVCYIYENDGRLISSARLVGGISDEEELKLLETTEGFRKLVHSIGVSVEPTDDIERLEFIFQMYGKKDMYSGGSNITALVPANGMEVLINLDELDWSDDDKEPGQIRFEFDKSGVIAKASVRFYLNDGYDAPEPEDEHPVDRTSQQYADMIAKSLVQQGNNFRVKKAIEKARSGMDTTLAFIGGSITQGAGAVPINTECYARKIFEGFCDFTGRAYDDNVHYIKAGVGGTPSELGMLRYEKDILEEGCPDLVIVEFAVNDEGDETRGECYDSLVRKIYNGPGSPAVILLFSVFADDFNLQERLSPVGRAYELPMVSVRDAVVPQFYLKNGEGRVVSKNQYFYDRFHPTNMGHRIMADSVLYMLKKADEMESDEPINSLSEIKAPIGGDFEKVIRIDRDRYDSSDNFSSASSVIINCGSIDAVDSQIQSVERNMDTFVTPQFANNWMYQPDSSSDFEPFTMDIECRILLIVFKDSGENNVGKADVFVDGKLCYHADPAVVGWTHANAAIVLRDNKAGRHHVEVHLSEGSLDKEFTILGFGYVE